MATGGHTPGARSAVDALFRGEIIAISTTGTGSANADGQASYNKRHSKMPGVPSHTSSRGRSGIEQIPRYVQHVLGRLAKSRHQRAHRAGTAQARKVFLTAEHVYVMNRSRADLPPQTGQYVSSR